ALGTGGNSGTTGQHGLTHNGGGNSDWWGYDDGIRDLPGEIIRSGQPVTRGNLGKEAISQLGTRVNDPNLYVLQQKDSIDPDFSFGASGGTAFELGDDLKLGLVGVASFDNEWRTRTGKQQNGVFTADGADLYEDYAFATTRNNARVNGLFGLGLQGARHSLAWSTLYVHDTIKETKSRAGYNFNVGGDIREDGTLWLERELVNHQLSGTRDR